MPTTRYPNYKDSGIDLIGEVPTHWSLKRADGVLAYQKETVTTDELAGREVLHYSIPSIQEFGEAQIEDGDSIASNKLRVTGGEILVSKLNPRKGTVMIVEGDHPFMVCSSEFIPLVPTGCNRRFAYYLYTSEPTRLRLSSLVESATKSHQRANPAAIYKMWNAFPPLEEQRQLAAYLDRKTGEIDALIQKKQALIALLREQRAALIHRAVTKGLDPDVPMKDSGVEWLGEVRAHWTVAQLRYVAGLGSGNGITSEEIEPEGDYPVYGGNGIRGFTTEYTHEGHYALIGRQGALCGNINFAEGKFWASEHAVVVTPYSSNRTVWLGNLLRTMNLGQYSVAAAQPGISVESIKALRVPVPPLEEQAQIEAYIMEKTAQIEAVLQKEAVLMNRLRELRASLISEVVTGKIDVRGETAPHTGLPVGDLAA